MKVHVVKRHKAESLSPGKEVRLIRNANVQKKNAENEKNRRIVIRKKPKKMG